MKTLFARLALSEGTCGFPTPQKVNAAHLWFFFELVEQTVEYLVIVYPMALMWRKCNGASTAKSPFILIMEVRSDGYDVSI